MSADATIPAGGDLAQVVPYCEPIYRFCVRRLGDTPRAEDLAQEILAEAIEGLTRRTVRNVEAWIWTIARNRYRRLFMVSDPVRDAVTLNVSDLVEPPDRGAAQRLVMEEERELVFRAVVGIADKYRRVLVAYYVHGDSYEEIARRLAIPMSSVKWRIHEGRRRLRERWDSMMDEGSRIYERIDWRVGCNGSMDPNRYLGRQIARAIARAAYQAPLTVEEISRTTAIPAVYIEDELEALLYGEALEETRGRYATSFIILGLDDHRRMVDCLQPITEELASSAVTGIRECEAQIRGIGFHGSDQPLADLLWILVPRVLRAALDEARRDAPELQGDYPPRTDGGKGWFVVAEGSPEDHRDAAGQNNYGANEDGLLFRYYWIGRYHHGQIDRALSTLSDCRIPGFIAMDGRVDAEQDEVLAATMLECGLARRRNGAVLLAVPLLTRAQEARLAELMDEVGAPLGPQLAEFTQSVAASYKKFTPERLHGQIRGVVGSALHNLVGMVVGHLEARGAVERSPGDRPHAKSVMVERVRGE